ncbi:MAG: gliding motility-associated C-terminal domain-containing protein [Bacteroidia bacterium]
MNALLRIVTITALMAAFVTSSLRAQNILDNKIYRVTAYKKGDNSITSTSNYAEVIPPVSIYIPSAFTPNGDGINDAFFVKGEGIRDFHLYIYNRWGEVIFESTNAKSQWDGTFQGKPVQQDVYVYQVFANGLSPKGKTGSVTVIY